jgi:hypothetical protein
MAELSPAAQAIVNAAVEAGGGYGRATPTLHARLAAALRSAADQVVPPALEEEFHNRNQALPLTKMVEIRKKLLAIAAELENGNG